jgi:putative ABC transport system permease protein
MTIIQDLKFGVRVLAKKPGYTVVATLVTALGIGANTAIFSVVNAVLLRPLPFDHPERIVKLTNYNTKTGGTGSSFSYPNFADLRDENDSLEALTAYDDHGATLTGDDLPERINGLDVGAQFFDVLGTKPLMGRTFSREDEQPGTQALIISYGLWQRRFGSDPNVLGRTLTLSGKIKTIIGVLPGDFRFSFVNDPPEYFETFDPKGQMEVQRGASFISVLARLKPTVTVQQAESDLQSVAAKLEEKFPQENASETVQLVSAQDDLVGKLRLALFVLLGAVGFVLLVACANVANLQLSRSAGRSRELAVRMALGAGRGRIISQLLTESIVLSLLGGAFGLLFAMWGIDLISAFVPSDVPRFKETSLDTAVLGFTLLATLLTGVVFGMAPAIQASRVDLNEALKDGGRGATEGRARIRTRSVLIVWEVALSLVLLTGAGLLIRSFIRLRNTEPGFNPKGVLTASVSLPAARYSSDEKSRAFYKEAIQRISQLANVDSVGAILPLPLGENSISTSFTVEGQPDPGPAARPVAGARIVTPDYIRAMGIPLVAGRIFDDRDTPDSPKVLLINETFAKRHFGDESAIGKRLAVGLNGIHGEIVGVVGDVRDKSLELDPRPEYYVPYEQVPVNTTTIVIRSKEANPLALAAATRGVIHDLDKDLAVYQVRPMSSLVEDSIARQRFSMSLLTIFSGIALVLAAAGLFSVMSFSVAHRTHEIGVRLAVGAQRRDVLSMVIGHGMRLTGTGIGIGLLASFLLTRLLESMLFGISATDSVTFGMVALLLSVISLLACYLPARRAARVDPMVALRYE